jgi:hypothetical protein
LRAASGLLTNRSPAKRSAIRVFGLVQQRVELAAVLRGQRIAGTEGGKDLLQHLARLAVAGA